MRPATCPIYVSRCLTLTSKRLIENMELSQLFQELFFVTCKQWLAALSCCTELHFQGIGQHEVIKAAQIDCSKKSVYIIIIKFQHCCRFLRYPAESYPIALQSYNLFAQNTSERFDSYPQAVSSSYKYKHKPKRDANMTGQFGVSLRMVIFIGSEEVQ